MAILHMIGGRERDLGGFVVRRVLPAPERQMVGPFIFFDHLGPTQFAPAHGIDVRPHPHVSLATVTYLFCGCIEHRDSLGSVQQIRPGDVNWMTAGHGIAHSERTPPELRAGGDFVHGIQSWVALPDGAEDIDPAFDHYAAGQLPQCARSGVDLTVIAGEAFGLRSPVRTHWPTLYADARFAAQARIRLEDSHEERAVYVVEGELDVAGRPVVAGQLAVIETHASPELRAERDSRAMLIGGARFTTPRHIWWNFVASSEARIEAARSRWRDRGFPSVPGETEFIPLPQQ